MREPCVEFVGHSMSFDAAIPQVLLRFSRILMRVLSNRSHSKLVAGHSSLFCQATDLNCSSVVTMDVIGRRCSSPLDQTFTIDFVSIRKNGCRPSVVAWSSDTEAADIPTSARRESTMETEK